MADSLAFIVELSKRKLSMLSRFSQYLSDLFEPSDIAVCDGLFKPVCSILRADATLAVHRLGDE